MAGSSQILQIMASIFLFGMVVLNTSRQIVTNTLNQVQTELEQEVITLAQDIIEEANATSFDEVTQDGNIPVFIPGGFSPLGQDEGEAHSDRTTFDDFDDYHNWSQVIQTEHGPFLVLGEVFYIDAATEQISDVPTSTKRLEITVESKFLRENGSDQKRHYKFNAIRSFFAN